MKENIECIVFVLFPVDNMSERMRKIFKFCFIYVVHTQLSNLFGIRVVCHDKTWRSQTTAHKAS